MALPRFQYHEPASLPEACQMLHACGDTAALLAGGTDLLVKMKSRELCPQILISLVELEELKRIDFSGPNKSIGAGCTVSWIAESPEIRSHFPALATGAEHIGSPAIRNIGTIGGNVATASPAADLPPALMAYGARARLKSKDQERFVSLEKLFRGPGTTHIGENEILVDFLLEAPSEFSGASFFKIGNRRALQCSIINGACFISLNPQTGKIETARIVLGAVAPTAVRAHAAESMLLNEKPDKELLFEASRSAARDCRPIDDLRGTAEYRRDMVQVMTNKTLNAALEAIHRPLPGN